MKKFISFVMAAAMVASLVPATAFAATGDVKATAKVVDAWTKTQDDMDLVNGFVNTANVPELQLTITSADNQQTTSQLPRQSVTVTLDNAEFLNTLREADITLLDGDGHDLKNGVNSGVVTQYRYTAADDATVKAAVWAYLMGDVDALDNYVLVAAGDLNAWKNNDDDIVETLKAAIDDEAALHGVTKVTAEENLEAAFNQAANHAAAGAGTDQAKGEAMGFVNGNTAQFDDYNLVSGTYYKVTNATGPQTIPEPVVLGALNNGNAFVDTYTSDGATTNEDTWWGANGNNAKAGNTIATVATQNVVNNTATANNRQVVIQNFDVDGDELSFDVVGFLAKDDVISIDLRSEMTKTSKNATVSVDSKMVAVDDLVYVNVADASFTASVKKTVALAEDEFTNLHENGLKLKEVVENTFVAGDTVSLKLSKGLEFRPGQTVVVNDVDVTNQFAYSLDDNEIEFEIDPAMLTAAYQDADGLVTLTICVDTNGGATSMDDGLVVESKSAKAGTVGTITAKVGNLDKVVVDVVEIVDYKVMMTVDEDEDVPVIYSGVNVNNDGITDDSDHETLEITLEETFPGAWSSRQGFDITVPDGVYVTNVRIVDTENFFINEQSGLAAAREMTPANWLAAFTEAYQDGDHKNFEFGKRVFDDVDVTLPDDVASLTFVLELVADPGFEGDVEIGFEGALVDTQSVVAAKFVAPYTVTAEQNDLKIDSRYTSIPTDIVVKETADGLWDDRTAAIFVLGIEKGLISFEDDATFTVDKDSELDIDDDLVAYNGVADSALLFEVTDTSDKAATVTISDMELFMERNIPAGAYALELTTSMSAAYDRQILFANEDPAPVWGANNNVGDNFVDDVTDYSNVVKDKFINVITAPRDEDGFTTKITVPVGESYIIAGEVKVEIDTPAYINANGYTMLPLRAVAVALGIDNNSVLWDQSTRTATILYGNRVVSMQNGAKVMYINGQAVATKAGVEITNDRTFLSLRDLGTAMNVTDISWDAATRTAYLNAGVTEEA